MGQKKVQETSKSWKASKATSRESEEEGAKHFLPLDIRDGIKRLNNGSCVSREVHAQFCERLVVKFRRSTLPIAYKFPAARGKTKLEKILIQVGRTGVLTPVGKLAPINVGGVLISRVSLHNQDEIRRKDIREGDLIIVERAGDVIPKVVDVDKSARIQNTPEFKFPKVCPECGSRVEKVEEAAVRCTGEFTCKAQIIEKLKHFVSQEGFNITGLGDKQTEFFYNLGLIKQIPDIFTLEKRLNEFNLQEQHGWGERSIANLLSSINSRKTVSLDKFIYSLGIRFIGQYVAKLLANHYMSFDNWYSSMIKLQHYGSFSELREIDGIGEKIAESIRLFFSEERNIKMLNDLTAHLQILSTTSINTNGSILSNKVIVFTGTLLSMSRDEAKTKAETPGAKIASSISNKTDFLVVGENSGSKYKKALALGIKILNEDQWCEMISFNL